MDVYIKSAARPYYLDRCIKSIYRFLKGNFSITILDDGTLPEFLHQIKLTHPEISIRSSPQANEKREAFKLHLTGEIKFHANNLPFDFWKNEINKGSEYFLLLEEDAWLTADVDTDNILKEMKKNELVTLKLFWGSCERMVAGDKIPVGANLEKIIPKLPVSSYFLMKPFLSNRLKIRSFLLRSKILSPGHLMPYYALYSVASAFFRKDYWLYCWNDEQEIIAETNQLLRALQWRNENPWTGYGKTSVEKARTSYQTATFNTFNHIVFDMIRFNQSMSEQWLAGNLDVMQNFPADFTPEYLKNAGKLPLSGSHSAKNWDKWIQNFKLEYKVLGIRTE
jgi:hypothetical protein